MKTKHICIKNHFFHRNFDNHLALRRCDHARPSAVDYAFSDMMHDQNRGITHCYLHYDIDHPEVTRFVSDVEICMSPDPSITSLFTSEHRNAVRNGIASQPRTPVNGKQPSDDQLMQNGGIVSLERDEIVQGVKASYHALDASLPFETLAPAPSPAPSPAEVSSVTSPTSNS